MFRTADQLPCADRRARRGVREAIAPRAVHARLPPHRDSRHTPRRRTWSRARRAGDNEQGRDARARARGRAAPVRGRELAGRELRHGRGRGRRRRGTQGGGCVHYRPRYYMTIYVRANWRPRVHFLRRHATV